MQRLWTKDSTGVATNGRWYAGDVNQLQDAVAALSDFLQTLDVNVLRVGDASLQLLKYGSGEGRFSGALRTDGIFRALGGFYAGAFTTTTRNAIPTGFRPFGLVILNTTTNQLEINLGTDPSPVWKAVGVDPSGMLTLNNQSAGAYSLALSRSGDTNPRFQLREDGQQEWGPGSGASDVILTRSGAGIVNYSSGRPRINGNEIVSYLQGTYASIPSASSVRPGTSYFATDSLGRFISDGSSWTLIAQGRPVTTTLGAAPWTTPYDGMEAILTDSITSPKYQWHLKYVNGITADAFKWVCIGGEYVTAVDASADTHTDTGAAHGVGPTFTTPRAGLYHVTYRFSVYGSATNSTVTFGTTIHGGLAVASPGLDTITSSAGGFGNSPDTNIYLMDSGEWQLAASALIQLQIVTASRVNGTNTNVAYKVLSVIPHRLS